MDTETQGLMIALYAIAGLVAVIILIWFVMTLTSIDKGIRNIGDALWAMARTRKQKQEQTSATVTEASNETKLSDDEMRLIKERKKKNEERIAKAFSRDEEEKK